MSLIPVFEIGVWNAWIPALIYFIIPPALMVIINRQALMKSAEAPLSGSLKRIYPIITIIYFLTLIYSIFLPLESGTIWLFAGLAIYLVGLILYVTTWVNFDIASIDKPVFNGLYRYSRHPVYITQFLIFLGIGIASASWLFLVLGVKYTVFSIFRAFHEERYCLEKYDGSYLEYMNRTPRWIGIPKQSKELNKGMQSTRNISI